MNQKHVLVEHLGNINSVIKQPLQLTQRIKFTCFDVSQNYIVFGATSGGLYVFNRYPNVFIKLIPSKQGSVVQICISPNEKTIALASSKGLVIIIQNCFTETNVQYQVFCEHENNVITAMRWHVDEVYCGDNKGKVSVITLLPSLLTKAIFQTPSASLMQLDSSIFQIECHSKFLLISTHTRTYICDTDKEQYRQIGKKLRDGNFGACFFDNDINSEVTLTHASTSRGLFKKMKDDEQFNAHISDNIKIFCARPGTRMWEAKLDASVTRTHQFKNSLKRVPTSLIQLDSNVDSHLIINSNSESSIPELHNFSKVFMLRNKFVVTFNTAGFYIFDPETVSVIDWCNHFSNIKDIKINKNLIYIWCQNCEIHVVGFYELEKIILRTLFDKQYYICSELCVHYMKDLLEVVETSEKIHLILILKEKLAELTDKGLLTKLSTLFEAIQEFSEKKCIGQRLSTGIVVVNNAFIGNDMIYDALSENKCEKDQNLPETLQTLKEIGSNVTDKLTEGTKNLKEKFQILETTVKNLTLSDTDPSSDSNFKFESEVLDRENIYTSKDNNDKIVQREINTEQKNVEGVGEIDFNLKIFLQQYQSSKINDNLEIPKFNELLCSSGLDKILELFSNFLEYMLKQNAEEAHIKLWCYQYYLKHLSKIDYHKEIDNVKMEEHCLHFLSEAFSTLNFSSNCSCVCLFPLPSAKIKVPNFYKVGCAIIKKLWETKRESFEQIHREVPYMWEYIIRELRNNDDISSLLPLLIQFGDENLIAIFLNKFKYDTWDDATQSLIKLKKGICVNCDKKFDNHCDILSWTKFGMLMVQSIGGSSTVDLLTRYANFIPSHELNSDFYQSCIFVTAVDNFCGGLRKEALTFTKTMKSDEGATLQFDKVMATLLQKNYNMKKPIKYPKNSILPVEKTDLKCSFCDLPLEIPLLKSDVKLNCNHVYHTFCLEYNKNICEKCKK